MKESNISSQTMTLDLIKKVDKHQQMISVHKTTLTMATSHCISSSLNYVPLHSTRIRWPSFQNKLQKYVHIFITEKCSSYFSSSLIKQPLTFSQVRKWFNATAVTTVHLQLNKVVYYSNVHLFYYLNSLNATHYMINYIL